MRILQVQGVSLVKVMREIERKEQTACYTVESPSLIALILRTWQSWTGFLSR